MADQAGDDRMAAAPAAVADPGVPGPMPVLILSPADRRPDDAPAAPSAAAPPLAWRAEGLALSRHGPDHAVLVIALDNGPGNPLTAPLRAALLAAVQGAVDAGARAVVLTGQGAHFSTSCSIDMPDGDLLAAPDLSDLCHAVETCPIPVIAALQGSATGPGAELALAAHARVAVEGARILLPEVGFGLPPCGGSSQRLPRLVGTATTLDLLLKAQPMTATDGVAAGVIDHLLEPGSDPAALIAAAMAAAATRPQPALQRPMPPAAAMAHARAIAAARAEAKADPLPAPGRIIDCVDAALYLPPEAGLALERVAFEDLAATPQSHALIAAGRAERRAATALVAARMRGDQPPVARLALNGAGAHAAALVWMALTSGLEVVWTDADPARLARGLDWLEEHGAGEVAARRMTAVQRDADRARLTVLPAPGSLQSADLVIHGAEDAGAAALMQQLPRAGHLIFGGARDGFGLALAPSMRLAELALPAGAASGAAAGQAMGRAVQIHDLLRRISLSPVVVGHRPVVGRSVAAAGQAALAWMRGAGVPAEAILAALAGFGQTAPQLPDPGIDAPPRSMPQDEILRRWLSAMANAGLRLVADGTARRASDIDHILVQGHGFPRWQAGPMYQADRRGMLVLRADLARWAAEAPIWDPHPLLDRLVSEGRSSRVLEGV